MATAQLNASRAADVKLSEGRSGRGAYVGMGADVKLSEGRSGRGAYVGIDELNRAGGLAEMGRAGGDGAFAGGADRSEDAFHPHPERSAKWSDSVRLGVEFCTALAALYAFDLVFHNPMCGTIYACGCSWPEFLGGSGWTNCNVHNTHGPQCPWCLMPYTRKNLVFLVSKWPYLILAMAAFALTARLKWRYRTRASAAVLTYFAYGLIIGLVFFFAEAGERGLLGREGDFLEESL